MNMTTQLGVGAFVVLANTAMLLIGQTGQVPFLENPYVQWGSLGICASTIAWLLCRTIPSMMSLIREQRQENNAALAQIFSRWDSWEKIHHDDREKQIAAQSAASEKITQALANCQATQALLAVKGVSQLSAKGVSPK
jgi:hypothetical protein